MDVANEILDAIEIIVDKKIRENTAQIYFGVCKGVSGDSCVMSINGKNNTIHFYGSAPIVGLTYRVFVPNGNMSMAFAITGNDDRKGLYYSNPNLLDNWYFGNPVNQRGKTEYAVEGYTIDRWKSGAVSDVVGVVNGAITIGMTDLYQIFSQSVESPELYAGKPVTASVLVDSIYANDSYQLVVRTGTASGQYMAIVINGSGLYSTTWKIPEGATSLQVGIQSIKADAGSISVKAIKLELGSQQTLAHKDADGNWILNEIPDYGEQLRRCQRYFVNFNPYKMEWFVMPPAVASSAYQAYSAVTLPVAMRTQPSVSFGGKIVLSQAGDNIVTGILISESTFTGNSIQLRYDVEAGGLTANSLYRVQGGNDSTSYIWLSADL